MSTREEDFHPISALQHMAFCPRQAGLIHLEQVWAENKRTAEGRTLHERVDEGYREFRKGLRQISGIRVHSRRLEIAGRLDVLELEPAGTGVGSQVRFLGVDGNWCLLPVEFKRGEPKEGDWDEVQLCAQAMCLEEMTNSEISVGAIFYGEIRRRVEVPMANALRDRTTSLVREFAAMMESKRLPAAVWQKGCRACSLMELCQPKAGTKGMIDEYRKDLFA